MADPLSFYTSRYALINDGIVGNVIIVDSADTAQLIASSTGYDQAVCVDQYFVTIGDAYTDGAFYHEGNELERQRTLEETVAQQTQEISDLQTLVLQLGGVI